MVSRVSQRQQLSTLSNGICSFTAEHSFLWNISLLKKTEQGIDWWHNFGILYFPSCSSSPALDPGILRRDHHQSCRPLIGDLSSISDNLSVLSKFWCSKPAGVSCMWISVIIHAQFGGNSLIKGTERFCFSRKLVKSLYFQVIVQNKWTNAKDHIISKFRRHPPTGFCPTFSGEPN